MPGFDQTGPRGEGPMTGGQRGICDNPDNAPQGRNTGFGVGRGGRPWGGGRGRCFGGRGGRGMGRGFSRTVPPTEQPADRAELQEEIQELSNAVSALRAEIAALKGDA